MSDWYFHLIIQLKTGCKSDHEIKSKIHFNSTNAPLNSPVPQLSTSIPQTTDAQWRCNGTALQINRHNYIVVHRTPVSVWLSVLYLSRQIPLARTRRRITGKAFTELRKLGLRSECILCPGRCVLDSIKSDNNTARVRHLAIWHRNEIFPRGSSWRMFTDLWLKVSRFRNFSPKLPPISEWHIHYGQPRPRAVPRNGIFTVFITRVITVDLEDLAPATPPWLPSSNRYRNRDESSRSNKKLQ